MGNHGEIMKMVWCLDAPAGYTVYHLTATSHMSFVRVYIILVSRVHLTVCFKMSVFNHKINSCLLISSVCRYYVLQLKMSLNQMAQLDESKISISEFKQQFFFSIKKVTNCCRATQC